MSAVIVYSTAMCPYCVRAKQLLQRKGIEYREIRVDLDPEQMQIMRKSSRRRSVPQIFIGAYHVGGYDDLSDLDMQGKLDDILQQNLI
ncbi:MAG TPA: glutaredoxin 3 [Chromatiaceae bacterium]|nr:glutaredoxin 3 [Chromatiaceae bacterium]HIN82662.1 glutaredoxin 3 [Chromatiales bacterium]HIA08133.1 glutaredoxin 3 [Chromatiaceae bacterium]HIB84039.1 glutaredoxin 3 [Chromatiaceae bacterium]HIO14482.1 glutaredoxin 3 [Chromatiales bacterium]